MNVTQWTAGALPRECDLVIVGGGFGGLTALVRALEHRCGWRILIVERHPRSGPGIAYGGCDSHHLLNVPASRMGALPEDPGAFHMWLERTQPGRFAPGDFVPRSLFAAYVDEMVAKAFESISSSPAAPADPPAPPPVFAKDALVRAEPLSRHVDLLFGSGTAVRTRALMMAPGLPAARAPWRAFDEDVPLVHLAPDPWAPTALAGISPEAPVVIVGSGLTAIDIVSALRRRGHKGHITMLSRSGRLPLAHADGAVTNSEYDQALLTRGVRDALRAVRVAAKDLRARNLPWQGALDGLRSLTSSVWASWSIQQRARFLKHIRPLWEVHRHRAPRPLLDDLAAQQHDGSISIVRGAVRGLRCGPSGVIVTAHSSSGVTRELPAARVINCAGPAQGVRDTADPLIASLLQSGVATTDELGIGLHTDAMGRLAARDGSTQERIWLVGALRRGDLWESTAVPELRAQVAQAIDGIAALLHRR
jgi:uncharacterized NAD(P)/FAD-binding protein YdhS